MDPAILLMLTVEKRFETRRQEYMPRRDQRESVEPARRFTQNDLTKRILDLIRRQQPCEC